MINSFEFLEAESIYSRVYARCLADKIDAYDSKADEITSFDDDSVEMRISIAIDERIRGSLVTQWERLTGRSYPQRGPQ